MPVGVRARLLKWAVWLLVLAVAVGGVFFGPAIVTDVMARNGTFQTTKRKFERLRNIAYWRSPEQKRLIKGIDGPKKPASEPRTYYVPRN